MDQEEYVCPECEDYSDEDSKSVYFHAMSAHSVNLHQEHEEWPHAFKLREVAHNKESGFSRDNVEERKEKQSSTQDKGGVNKVRSRGILGRIRDLFSR